MTEEGLNFVKRFEGLRTRSYLCPAGVWTIGYGHTGPTVKDGLVITKEEAEALLLEELVRFEEGVVRATKIQLQPLQIDALTSFAYNLGLGALRGSTLLKKVNRGQWEGIDKEFDKWVYGGGKILPGLVRRRKGEAEMFCRAIKEL